MGKYQSLTYYLENQSAEIWEAKFSEIEHVLGFPLPRSAHEYPAWWANQQPGHSQTRGWRDAGWETSQVDLGAKTLKFRKGRRPIIRQPIDDRSKTRADLLERARLISDIEDKDQLIDAALTCFINREAGRQLAEMGGTMPDAEAPPRRRFSW